jgi:anti-sigma factor RsiW
MESLTMHDLTAAYALDALDAEEAREYEDHLATCERCRAELAQLGGAASALAFAVESPAPSEILRSRILEAARAERPNVVPLRSRWTGTTQAIAAVAAVATVAAIAFGIWSISLSRSLDRERSVRERIERVLADPAASRLSVSGNTTGTLVVAGDGEAALIVSKLDRAPAGSVYEAWVIHNDKPLRAATFAGGGNRALVLLERPVPKDSLVAVTLERKPGADTPHGKILLHSQST